MGGASERLKARMSAAKVLEQSTVISTPNEVDDTVEPKEVVKTPKNDVIIDSSKRDPNHKKDKKIGTSRFTSVSISEKTINQIDELRALVQVKQRLKYIKGLTNYKG